MDIQKETIDNVKKVSFIKSLGAKLLFLTVILLIVSGLCFDIFLSTAFIREYSKSTDAIIVDSEKVLIDITITTVTQNELLFRKSVARMTEFQAKTLKDIPFDLFRGDEYKIRKAVDEKNKEINERAIKNFSIFSEYLLDKTKARIIKEIKKLKEDQIKEGKILIAQTEKKILALFFILILLLVFSNSLWVYKMIIKPMRKLIEGHQRVSEGNLTYRVEIKSTDEVGNLIDSFNKMAQDLNTTRQNLITERNKIKSIIDGISDGLSILDKDYNIIYQNEVVLNMFGNHLGEKCYNVYECKDSICKDCPVTVAFKDGKVHTIEKKVILPNGKEAYFEITANPVIDADGCMNSCLEIARNITKRKKAEKKEKNLNKILENRVAERTADLQNANEKLILINNELKETQLQLIQSSKLASIGELATGVAHELNQPLSYIRNGVQLMMMDSPEDYNFQEIYETLKKVEKGTDRMMLIINNLRRFSRQTIIEFIPFDIHKVIDNTLIFYNEQFKVHNILIEKKFASGLPKVAGNSNQIEQVFINLISNARDALDEKEEARLIIKTDFQPKKNDPGIVSIKFIDNGMGISLSNQEKIFDPFFTTKEEGEGTGLGLSISYGIIKEHKGNINVSSIEGKGTTFTIRLPALKKDMG
ncbi:two-component system, NtrC family, sensor kinase [Candidatus Magnetomoraceae bacterium gMMP-15]